MTNYFFSVLDLECKLEPQFQGDFHSFGNYVVPRQHEMQNRREQEQSVFPQDTLTFYLEEKSLFWEFCNSQS
jgi:hypothetical protein